MKHLVMVLQQLLGPRDAVRTYLVSPLPSESSPATQRIRDSFVPVGESLSSPTSPVNLELCLYREAHTQPASSYIIRSEQTGSRTIVNYNDLPEMTVGEFEAVVRRFSASEDTWWHFEGRIPDTTLECVRTLRDKLPNAQISVEVEKPGRDGLRELAAEADVVFYSKSWAESCGHGSAESCLIDEQRRRKAKSLALCTWGAEGAAALRQPSEQVIRCPVESRAKSISVVDSVGAGDTFVAGMLYSLVCRSRDWDVSHGLRFAVHLATTKVQREGFQGLGAHVRDWLVWSE
ncbi:Ribokinase-like protein [Trichoderma citrinoviride]|uniref:Ribokinase-like protein n=1 Tax=Trichoderma citrinoviride TaxID=58853 RepID=A0A2T4B0M1_9HYPO|nr:Ribokinase-like protein [Trichoderma citrinoviride]PTB62873.1 Ribokinase-like protein [Trichoderma citrinoviride]